MMRNMRRLQNAGFCPAAPGAVALVGPAQTLFQRWLQVLPAALEGHAETAVRAPLFISRRVLEMSGYLAHFPHQIIPCRRGSPGACLTPAACLHVYPGFRGRRFAAGEACSTLILARCARYEGGRWSFPFRLADFHMMEVVVLGDETRVTAARARMASLASALLNALRIPGTWTVATDAFFLGNDDGARRLQQLKALKHEFTARVAGHDVALASLNNHEDYFFRRFGIGQRGIHAASFCLAFGIERLTAAGLLLWGGSSTHWPRELRP